MKVTGTVLSPARSGAPLGQTEPVAVACEVARLRETAHTSCTSRSSCSKRPGSVAKDKAAADTSYHSAYLPASHRAAPVVC